MPTHSQSRNMRSAAADPIRDPFLDVFALRDLPEPLDHLDRTRGLLGLGHVHPATNAGLIWSGKETEAARRTDIDLEVQEVLVIRQVNLEGMIH